MLEEQIKKEGILGNFIGLFNLIEGEINDIIKELSLNQLEFSILAHISHNEVTQYKISKKYNISVQRTHQIVKKLLKEEYITFEKGVINGRVFKTLIIKPEISEKVEKINNQIISSLKGKKIKHSKLRDLNSLLKLFLSELVG